MARISLGGISYVCVLLILCFSLKEVFCATSSLAYRRETLLNHESRQSEFAHLLFI